MVYASDLHKSRVVAGPEFQSSHAYLSLFVYEVNDASFSSFPTRSQSTITIIQDKAIRSFINGSYASTADFDASG